MQSIVFLYIIVAIMFVMICYLIGKLLSKKKKEDEQPKDK